MRRFSGDTIHVNNALETISAAATAMASAEARVPPSDSKRRWGSCWSIYWCFGSQKQNNRVSHSTLVPEPITARVDASVTVNPTQALAVAPPFFAPPSSPASFLQSESPSAIQSPALLRSTTSVSACMYSPGDRPSIFAIGPYAHETQLVSPPVFSTFTTEPSTAPFTPPPETASAHLTTPSSPEVPFAKLLDPDVRNGDASHGSFPSSHEFQSYHLHPGSPVSHLISPRSGVSGSGTLSPFPDPNTRLDVHKFQPSKFPSLARLSIHEWDLGRVFGAVTPDSMGPSPRGNEMEVDRRVSFELTPGNVVRCMEKEPTALCRAVSASFEGKEGWNFGEVGDGQPCFWGDTINEASGSGPMAGDVETGQHQKHRSITLGSIKEFDFEHADGQPSKDGGNAGWWANEQELTPSRNWLFPMLQQGVS